MAGESAEGPIVISFWSGADYYRHGAERLREDCARLQVDCDIVELPRATGDDWLRICRRKVPFYLEMMRKHRRPLFWIDADCRLLRRPDFLAAGGCDVAAFLRGFKYLREFDPMAATRLLQPSFLFFNHTGKSVAFLEFMARLEREKEEAATDDYFLQEAWRQFDEPLALMLLPPDLVTFELPARADACLFFGVSGNVPGFRAAAEQHEAELHLPARRKAVFLREAAAAARSRRPSEARFFLKQAYRVDPADDDVAWRVARSLRRAGGLDRALTFLQRHRRRGASPVDHPTRFLADARLESGELEEAEALLRGLEAQGGREDRAWAGSRLLRLGLETRARALGVAPEERPPLWWMEGPYPGNVGDILNPYLVEKLSGIPPRPVSRGKGILAVGSVIKFAGKGTPVWGSGTPRMSDRLCAEADYRAVRGPLTRRLVLESGGACPEIYGDPAWLLPRLYLPPGAPRKYRLGVVRHYLHTQELRTAPEVKAISVSRGSYAEIERFIDELNECEAILSTSLHGIIIAHAYGIPARWCEVPDAAGALPGDGTKFRDYLLSVGLDPEPPLSLPRDTLITQALAAEARRLPARPIDLDALLAAAPFPVRRP